MKRIASSFHKEMHRSREKYGNAEFLFKFVNETVHNFEKENEEVIIPEWLFDVRKPFRARLPVFPANEKFSKLFTKKREGFTNGWIKLIIIWDTHVKLIKKDKVQHHDCLYCYIHCYIRFYAHVQII